MSTPNQLTDQERADGWQLLFDGQSTEHFRGYKKDEFPDGWHVVDGTIHRADKAGDIITKQQFADFEFSIEWKNQDKGNSGIMFRVTEDRDHSFMTGPEYQILNDDLHPDGQDPKRRTSSNYALIAPSKPMSNPLGEWNHTVIKVVGPHVEHWLNGEKVVAYELWTEEWKAMVAATKFADWPQYGMNKAGHICLQDHQDPVWFRSIKVREL